VGAPIRSGSRFVSGVATPAQVDARGTVSSACCIERCHCRSRPAEYPATGARNVL
jgi:hypothetical protein